MQNVTTLNMQLHGLVHALDALGADILKKHSDLNYAQFQVLLCIYQNPGRSQRFAADWLQLTQATISHMIKGVQGAGYITVSPHPVDARTKELKATAKGAALVERLYPRFEATLGPHFAKVESRSLDELSCTISKIRDSIAEDNYQAKES